jgi:hypothetical protein
MRWGGVKVAVTSRKVASEKKRVPMMEEQPPGTTGRKAGETIPKRGQS